MKLSEIPVKDEKDLSEKLTFILSTESKLAIVQIARAKRRTPSEVVREIVDRFLTNNQEELKSL